MIIISSRNVNVYIFLLSIKNKSAVSNCSSLTTVQLYFVRNHWIIGTGRTNHSSIDNNLLPVLYSHHRQISANWQTSHCLSSKWGIVPVQSMPVIDWNEMNYTRDFFRFVQPSIEEFERILNQCTNYVNSRFKFIVFWFSDYALSVLSKNNFSIHLIKSPRKQFFS